MNEENTKYLKERFLFLRTQQNIEGRAVSLGLFGFECGDGWFKLIEDLCFKIERLNIPHLHVHQVKEKFGGLRFYTGPVQAEPGKALWYLITTAEDLSMEVCELCGKSGTQHSRRGWIKTVCEGCAVEWTSKKS